MFSLIGGVQALHLAVQYFPDAIVATATAKSSMVTAITVIAMSFEVMH